MILYLRLSTIYPQLSKQALSAMWALVDPNAAGSVEVAALHDFLGTRFGKDKSFKPASIVDRVLVKIRERAGTTAGIAGLKRYCVTAIV